MIGRLAGRAASFALNTVLNVLFGKPEKIERRT